VCVFSWFANMCVTKLRDGSLPPLLSFGHRSQVLCTDTSAKQLKNDRCALTNDHSYLWWYLIFPRSPPATQHVSEQSKTTQFNTTDTTRFDTTRFNTTRFTQHGSHNQYRVLGWEIPPAREPLSRRPGQSNVKRGTNQRSTTSMLFAFQVPS
jgi:hypothetical protein